MASHGSSQANVSSGESPPKVPLKASVFSLFNSVINKGDKGDKGDKDKEKQTITKFPFLQSDSMTAPPLNTNSSRVQFKVVVVKGNFGLGLDLNAYHNSCPNTVGVFVVNVKVLPSNEPNPCLVCDPPLRVGDQIVAVKGQSVLSLPFLSVIEKLKESGQTVELTIERASDVACVDVSSGDKVCSTAAATSISNIVNNDGPSGDKATSDAPNNDNSDRNCYSSSNNDNSSSNENKERNEKNKNNDDE